MLLVNRGYVACVRPSANNNLNVRRYSLKTAPQTRLSGTVTLEPKLSAKVAPAGGESLLSEVIRHGLNFAGLLLMFWGPCLLILLNQRPLYRQLSKWNVAPTVTFKASKFSIQRLLACSTPPGQIPLTFHECRF
eukprot:gene21592-28591_t